MSMTSFSTTRLAQYNFQELFFNPVDNDVLQSCKEYVLTYGIPVSPGLLYIIEYNNCRFKLLVSEVKVFIVFSSLTLV